MFVNLSIIGRAYRRWVKGADECRKPKARGPGRLGSYQPRIELLEDRCLLAASGPEFLINGTTGGAQLDSAMAMDAAGDFVVVYEAPDNSGLGVFGQRYDAAGNAIGVNFKANTTFSNDQRDPDIAMDDTGRFVVAWKGNGTGDANGIFGQRYNADGTKAGAEFRINDDTAEVTAGKVAVAADEQHVPHVAMDNSGNFVVTWWAYVSAEGKGFVYGKWYNSAGTPLGNNGFGGQEFVISSINNDPIASNAPPEIDVAVDADGNRIVFVWSNLTDKAILGRRATGAGTGFSAEFVIEDDADATKLQKNPQVAMDDAGNFVVAWQAKEDTGSGDWDIEARRYVAAGTADGAKWQVNTTTATDQQTPAIAMDPTGRFVVAWDTNVPGDSVGVAVQEYDAAKNPVGSETRANTTTTNNQLRPASAMLQTGTFVVSWDGNGPGDGDGVFGQRFSTNGVPVAVANGYSVNEDTTLNVDLPGGPGVLGNDTDGDGPSALTAVLVTDVAKGALTLNANGSFTYTPNANYNGNDSFTYRAFDGLFNSTPATVTITVNSIPDVPVAVDDSYTVTQNIAKAVPARGVLTNDSDGDNDPLTAILVAAPTNGSVTLNTDGSFTYTPNPGYTGPDSFTYKANDGSADSNVATVSLTVVANVAPVALADSYKISKDKTFSVAAPGVLANDSDANNDPLSAVLVTGVSNGSLTLNSNGSFTYTPDPGYTGPDSFTYRATDTNLNSSPVTVTFTIVSGGITVTPISGLVTSEAGKSASFTVVLDNAPAANVTVGLSSSDTTEGTPSAASLVFTTANWSTPQTVTINGVDDPIDDGNIAYTILTAVASSTDANYDGLNPDDVSVINWSNDKADIVVTPVSGLLTTEAGGTATFTVALASEPTADVTISLTSSNLAEGTVSPGSLTFTNGYVNGLRGEYYDGPLFQNLVGIVVDPVIDFALDNGPNQFGLLDALSDRWTGEVWLEFDESYRFWTQTDDGIRLWVGGKLVVDNWTEHGPTWNSGTLGPADSAYWKGAGWYPIKIEQYEDDGQNYMVLDYETVAGAPTGNVPRQLVPNSNLRTPQWSVPQTVTVRGVDDAAADGSQVYSIVTSAAVSTDPAYSLMNASDVSVTNLDDDDYGITVTPTSIVMDEGGSRANGLGATFKVVLNKAPAANVSIGLTSSDAAQVAVSTATLTFTPTNWNVAQTVWVSAIEDFVAEGNLTYSIATAAATGDVNYAGRNAPDVSVTVTDDDTAGIVVTPSSGLITTEGGGTAKFSVGLSSVPAANVTVGLSSNDTTEGTVGASVVVPALTNTIPTYPGLKGEYFSLQTLAAANLQGVYLDPQLNFTAPAMEDILGRARARGPDDYSIRWTGNVRADTTATYTFYLKSAGSVRLWFNDPAKAGPATIDNWVDHTLVTDTFTAALTAGNFYAIIVEYAEDSGSGTDETVVLEWSSPSVARQVIPAANLDGSRPVTVTGVNDAISDGPQAYTVVTAAATSTDAAYNGMDPSDVSLTNLDNEAAGIAVIPSTGLVTSETGQSATFTVAINTTPTDSVTIGLAASDGTEGSLSRSSVTFGRAPGLRGDYYDGTAFNTWMGTYQDLTINFNPADTPLGTNRAGGADTYSVRWTGQVRADFAETYTFRLFHDDGGRLWVNGTLVIDQWGTTGTHTGTYSFGSAGWYDIQLELFENTGASGVTLEFNSPSVPWQIIPQTKLRDSVIDYSPKVVTVTGVDDYLVDGDVAYSIITSPDTATADGAYNGLDPANVSLTNIDDDGEPVLIAPTSGLVTTEAGGTATFSVVLSRKPTASVTIPLSSSDTTEGTIGVSSLVFTTANWNVPQVVTVTGVSDAILDGNVAYSIVTGYVTSSDPYFSRLNPPNVGCTNIDKTSIWDGGSLANSDWTTAQNWVGDVAPPAGNVLGFPDGAARLANNNSFVGTDFGINLTGGGYVLGGNSLSLSGNLVDSSTSGVNNRLAMDFDFASAQSIQHATAGRTLELDGALDNAGFLLTAGGNGNINFNGIVSGSGGLSKDGAGTVTLAAANTYTGTTTVTAGTLLVNGSLPAGGSLAVNSGATLGGTGAVGAVTSTGGTIGPGVSGPGILSGASVVLNATSTFSIDINGAAAGSGHDQLVVSTGGVTLGGATLTGTLGFYPPIGSTYTIISKVSAGAASGTFSGLAEGASVVIGTAEFQISYIGGDGNDVVLTRLGYTPLYPVGGETRDNTTTASAQQNAAVAMVKDNGSNPTTAGNYVVVWEGNGPGDANGIFFQRYNAAGVPLGVETRVNTDLSTPGGSAIVVGDAQTNPRAAIDDAGNFVVTWWSRPASSAKGWIFGRWFNSAGSPLTGETVINTNELDMAAPEAFDVAANGANTNFVFVWSTKDDFEIRGQRYSAPGTAAGGEFDIANDATRDQRGPQVAMDDAGNFVVGWEESPDGGTDWDIYARRYTSAGSADGAKWRINTTTTGTQENPDVALDADGDFVVAWEGPDPNGDGVFAQRYNAAKTAQGSEFRANTYTTSGQEDVAVTIDDNGDFVIAWESNGQDGSSLGVYGQAYRRNGAADGVEFRVHSTTTNSQANPDVAIQADGHFVVVWNGQGPGDNDGVFHQLFRRNPDQVAGQFTINTYTTDKQRLPVVARDADGDFVVAWQSKDQDGGGYGIYAKRYNGSGAVQPITGISGEVRISTTTAGDQHYPAAAMSDSGQFVIVWGGNGPGDTAGIFAQRFNADGTANGGEMLINAYTTGVQRRPAVAMEPDGDFLVAWESDGQDGDGYGIYARRFLFGTGAARDASDIAVNQYTTGWQTAPSVALEPDGDFVVAWENGYNYRVGGTGDIYARRFRDALPTGAGLYGQFYDGTAFNTYWSATTDGTVDFTDSIGTTRANGNTTFSGRWTGSVRADYTETYTFHTLSDDGVRLWVNGVQVVNNWTDHGQTWNTGTIALQAGTWYDVRLEWYNNGGGGRIQLQYSSASESQKTIPSTALRPGLEEFRVNTFTTGYQILPTVATGAEGEFVVTWMSGGWSGTGHQDGSLFGVYGRRYDGFGLSLPMYDAGAGSAVTSDARVNTYTTNWQFFPSVAMDDDGDFVVTWTSYGQNGESGAIYAQRYNGSGNARGGELKVNSVTTGYQWLSRAAIDDDGDFVVVWEATPGVSSYDTYGQRFVAIVAQSTEVDVVGAAPGMGQLAAALDAAALLQATGQATGQGVAVASLDTGIDYTHPELAGNIWLNEAEIPAAVRSRLADVNGDGRITMWDLANPTNQGPGKITDLNANGLIDAGDLLFAAAQGGWSDGIDTSGNGFVDDLVGWDFVNGDNDPFDDGGHGTHGAGLLAQVAPRVEIVPVKILDGRGKGYVLEAIPALDYVLGQGISISLGAWLPTAFSAPWRDELQTAQAAGHLFVTVAGNSDPSLLGPLAEVHYDNVVTVGASDAAGHWAPFSNADPLVVDLAAPGVGIASTRAGGGFEVRSGTSVSAALVAATTALLRGAQPGLHYRDVVDVVFETAARTGEMARGAAFGQLDLLGVLARVIGLPANGNSGSATAQEPASAFAGPAAVRTELEFLPLGRAGTESVGTTPGAKAPSDSQESPLRTTGSSEGPDAGEPARPGQSGDRGPIERAVALAIEDCLAQGVDLDVPAAARDELAEMVARGLAQGESDEEIAAQVLGRFPSLDPQALRALLNKVRRTLDGRTSASVAPHADQAAVDEVMAQLAGPDVGEWDQWVEIGRDGEDWPPALGACSLLGGIGSAMARTRGRAGKQRKVV